MDVYFITGASKGIGFELSKQLIDAENVLVCVARTKNEELSRLAKENNCDLAFLSYDLSETTGVTKLMEQMIAHVPDKAKSVTLINNAGMIEPIGRTENNDPQIIAKSISVNLTAPMILSATFIKMLAVANISKKIVNISSGAGRKEYTGWSSYCATKAGLDHYTRVVSVEQSQVDNGVKMISIAPGIIDTTMQETIRAADPRDFERVEQFIHYKEQGALSSPKETAKKLIQLIHRPDFQTLEPILDIRHF